MLRKGLINTSVAPFFRQAVLLAKLGKVAETGADWLSVNAIISHMCLEEFLPSQTLTYLETACVKTARLVLDGVLRPSHSLRDPTVQEIVNSILRILIPLDLSAVWDACPQALLWISLALGPLAHGYARQWFRELLQQARRAAFISTAKDAMALLTDRFVMAHSLAWAAEEFWAESAIHAISLAQ